MKTIKKYNIICQTCGSDLTVFEQILGKGVFRNLIKQGKYGEEIRKIHLLMNHLYSNTNKSTYTKQDLLDSNTVFNYLYKYRDTLLASNSVYGARRHLKTLIEYIKK